MKKGFMIANIVIAEIVVMLTMLYSEFSGVELKAACSITFVTLGIVNLVYAILNKSNNLKFVIYFVVALTIAMVGDIVLWFDFVIGAAIFAVGHVFYFVAYCVLEKFHWKNLIVSACIFVPAALVILLYPNFDFGGILMQVVCLVYALIISLMLGKAISNVIKNYTSTNIIIALGSFLFFFSDLMLLFYYFGGKNLVSDILCLASYYTAQPLLAFSIFHSENVKYEKQNWII